MRTATVAAATVSLVLLTGVSAAQAAPSTRPSNGLAAGHVIRQHDCRPGAKYGKGVTGWLLDDVTTPRRELVYKTVAQAGNGGGPSRWTVLFTCYR